MYIEFHSKRSSKETKFSGDRHKYSIEIEIDAHPRKAANLSWNFVLHLTHQPYITFSGSPACGKGERSEDIREDRVTFICT